LLLMLPVIHNPRGLNRIPYLHPLLHIDKSLPPGFPLVIPRGKDDNEQRLPLHG